MAPDDERRAGADRRADYAFPSAEESEATHAVRTIERYKEKVKNPMTAIRAHCVECSGGSLKEVAECRIARCALYPFRMGENPFHKKTRNRLAAELGDSAEVDEDDRE